MSAKYTGGSVPLPGTMGDETDFVVMGSCGYWGPIGPSRSDAYYKFDNALDTFDERWQDFGSNITHGLRTIARKIDDKFGGAK